MSPRAPASSASLRACGSLRACTLSFALCLGLLIPAMTFAAHCQPSRFLEKRFVTYNFQDEGFLSNHVLQTVGQQSMNPQIHGGTDGARRLCLSAAERAARERSLRVMLHTRLNLQSNQPTELDFGASTFERDYPLEFTARDMIRAELDFRPLLDRGFIALQENRSRDACSVVFRIESRGDLDLPAEIRAVRLSFQPENQELWRKQRESQQRSQELQPAGDTGGSGLNLPPPEY